LDQIIDNGHALAKLVPDSTRRIGVSPQRLIADAGFADMTRHKARA